MQRLQLLVGVGLHDKAFRRLMKEKGVPDALVRERLPADLVALMAGAPTLLSESFVETTLKGTQADVVLRLPLRGGEAHVYCVLEHKRSEERHVLVQVLRYVTALTAWQVKTAPQRSPPLVIPLVIYNGERPWRGPRRFREVLGVPRRLQRLGVDFEVRVVDVGVEPLHRLSGHATLKGGLLGLKAAAVDAGELSRVVPEMLAALRGDESTRQFFLGYLRAALRGESLRVLVAAAETYRREKEPDMQSVEDVINARVRRAGQRAAKRAAKRGLEAGLRRAVRHVVTKRFKKVPEDLDARLAAADVSTLEKWLDLAVTAKSLKAVFH